MARAFAVWIAALFAMAALCWTGRVARAFCREVTASPPANFNPASVGCFATLDGGALPALFWRNQCVSYSFQRVGSKQISVGDATRIAAQAFSTWSNAPCPGGGTPNILADPYPLVDCNNPKSQGHNNVIIFRDDAWPYTDAVNPIGYTTLTIIIATGEIIGADIEINSSGYKIVADAPPPDAGGPMTYDLGSILTHEAGHFLGLAHSAQSDAVMFAHYHPGSTALTPDDVAGICSIYNPDGTRNTAAGQIAAEACSPAPPLGFSTACGSLDSGSYVGSGPLPDAGADGGDPPCPDASSCSVRPGSASRSASTGTNFGACTVLFAAMAGAALRRSRRVRPRVRAASIALGASIVWLGAAAIGVRDANASVSALALFDELVAEADAAAVVTPTADRRAVWEGNRIITYTRVRVERLIAGQLPAETWVRTLGGAVNGIGQIVEGEPTLAVGEASLLFLGAHVDPTTHAVDGPFVVVERAQGQFPIAAAKDHRPTLALAADVGALVPPPPEHWARIVKRLPVGSTPRYARDVLAGRPVDDAAREIAALWPRLH